MQNKEISKEISLRGQEWQEFSKLVLKHIEEYTVPQYGDRGEDPISRWKIPFCYLTIQKYLSRSFSSIREGQEKMDLLKIAHFSCMINSKLTERSSGL